MLRAHPCHITFILLTLNDNDEKKIIASISIDIIFIKLCTFFRPYNSKYRLCYRNLKLMRIKQ